MSKIKQHGIGRDSLVAFAGIQVADLGRSFGVFAVEKWSQEAVDWVGRKLNAVCIGPHHVLGSEALRLWLPPEEILVTDPNLLLNEGIQEMWDLIIGAGGAVAAFNNATADMGVGNSATAAAATDTGLIGASSLFKAMVATYPQRTAQTMDFRSDFVTAEANFAWEEASVRNGNTRNRNMNRKVQSLGTKTTGTWTLTSSITLA